MTKTVEVETARQRTARSIRDRRVVLGLPQWNAAIRSDITQAALCNIERGIHSPRLDTIMKIAKAYGTNVSELIGET